MHTLAFNLVWDAATLEGTGPSSLERAAHLASGLLTRVIAPGPESRGARPRTVTAGSSMRPDRSEWDRIVGETLAALNADPPADANTALENGAKPNVTGDAAKAAIQVRVCADTARTAGDTRECAAPPHRASLLTFAGVFGQPGRRR